MILGIIQARMGSSRLPSKTLMRIEGKPAIWHLIYRLKGSRLLSRIVVATTTSKKDDILVEYLSRNNVSCFRGSVNNVLQRYYKAARYYGCKYSDIIVRITADDILLDPKIVDMTIRKYLSLKTNRRRLFVSSAGDNGFPYGAGVDVFSFAALEKANKNASSRHEKEHVSPYFTNNRHIFKIISIKRKTDLSYIRLSIDYKEDLTFVRTIFKKLYRKPKYVFSLIDIVRLFKKEPQLLKINQIHNPKIAGLF